MNPKHKYNGMNILVRYFENKTEFITLRRFSICF